MPRSIITILIFLTWFITDVACGQIHNKNRNAENQANKNFNFDTSNTAIIAFDKRSKWPFDSTFKAAVLTQNELQLVDSFLLRCVANYNKSLDADHKLFCINIKKRNYRKQLIVVINRNGQKEIWVNCFCQVNNDKWKTEIFGVEDGGNCYFNFKINLATKKCYDLGVNGVA